ncbi:MAG: hypothetical protein RR764_08215 [Oscillospiraceae bacterium]
MKKIKRNLPFIMSGFVFAVILGIWIFMLIAQKGTRVTLSEGLSEHLQGFTLSGKMEDGAFRQTLTIKDGEIINKFVPSDKYENYNVLYAACNLALPKNVEYSALVPMLNGKEYKGSMDEKHLIEELCNGNSISYEMTTDKADIMANVYVDPDKRLQFNTGLAIEESGKIKVEQNFMHLSENEMELTAPFVRSINHNQGSAEMSVAKVKDKVFCTASTQKYIEGNGGIWLAKEYSAQKELKNLPKDIDIDGHKFVSPGIEYGKVEKIVDFDRGNNKDVLCLASAGDSLCLFTMENDEPYVHVYDDIGNETDCKKLPLNLKENKKITFDLQSTQREGDVCFSVSSTLGAGGTPSVCAVGGIRIKSGKIINMVTSYKVQEQSLNYNVGVTLDESGERLLALTGIWHEKQGVISDINADVFTNDKLEYSGKLLWGFDDDIKRYRNSRHFRAVSFANPIKDNKGEWYLPGVSVSYQIEKEAV